VSDTKPKRGGARSGAGRPVGDAEASAIRALVEAIRFVKVGRGNYTKTDRFRDFSRVFYGTDEGKRVLAQIMDLCEGPVTLETELPNHALLAGRAMSRRVGTLITAWASVPPPKDEPIKTQG
jgi:hypothetical protein